MDSTNKDTPTYRFDYVRRYLNEISNLKSKIRRLNEYIEYLKYSNDLLSYALTDSISKCEKYESVLCCENPLKCMHSYGTITLEVTRVGELFDKVEELEKKYSELLYAVENKYPNENRHETALRYIKQMQSGTLTAQQEKNKCE